MTPQRNGVFIVLEGADGSGKTTQFNLLTQRLRAVGYDVAVFDFPRYEQPSSHFVRSYLNGKYGSAGEVSPYTASLFYALDRFEAAPLIRKAISAGQIVLSNRYVGSNMAHQGGKFSDPVQQRGFFLWEDSLEYQMLGIPRPDLNIFLRVPAEVSYELIKHKAKRSYTDKTHDEHEKDIEHLKHSVETYDTLCKLFPKDFRAIECTQRGKLLAIGAINNHIWDAIKPRLPQKPPHQAKEVVVDLNKLPLAAQTQEQQEKGTKGPQKDQELTIKVENISLLACNAIQSFEGVSCSVSLHWDKKSGYQYYSLGRLPKKVQQKYKATLQKLITAHQQLASKQSLTEEDAVDNVVPLAALATVTISADIIRLRKLCSKIQLYPFEELQWLAQQLRQKIAEQQPTAEKAEPPKISTATMSELIELQLSQHLSGDTRTVSLLEVYPRREFELLKHALYPYSNSSQNDISDDLDSWSYSRKIEIFTKLLNDLPDLLLDKLLYRFSVIADTPTMSKLWASGVTTDNRMQPPTPRYGYEVPQIIEDANLEELYMSCFDESLQLFSELQSTNHELTSVYAVLLGHKNRWQFNIKGENVLSLEKITAAKSNSLTGELIEKISEIHPVLADNILNNNVTRASKKTKKRRKQPAKTNKRPGRSSSKK